MSPSVLQPLSLNGRRLLRVVVVLEPALGLEPDLARPRRSAAPRRPRRRCGSCPSAACRPNRDARATPRGRRRRSRCPRCRVVLVDDRPPPVDHLPLDVDGARAPRRGRPSAGSTRRSAPRSSSVELQHAHEVRRHELGVGDAVLLDPPARPADRTSPSRRPCRRGAAAGRPAERGGVVQRCGAQVDGVAGEAVQPEISTIRTPGPRPASDAAAA